MHEDPHAGHGILSVSTTTMSPTAIPPASHDHMHHHVPTEQSTMEPMNHMSHMLNHMMSMSVMLLNNICT